MAATANFELPLLVTAQAQKEVTHNEALVIIDALLRSAVEERPRAAPPDNPENGQCWLVSDAPSGAWSGAARHIAVWTEGGWRFVMPRHRMTIRCLTDGTIMTFNGNIWDLPATIVEPDGGSTVDMEARAVLAEVIQLLEGHGLVNSAL